MNEMADRRILGAFVCVDAITSLAVAGPVSVTAPGWKVKANHSGVYVIFDGPGFSSETTQFIPSGTWPPARSFEVALEDPNRTYLPRRALVKAPLSVPAIPPAPAGSSANPAALAALNNPATVFAPQPITLYRTPAGAVGLNWAVVRASVTRAGTTPVQGLPWAILQVTRDSDQSVLANGQANASGEALLAVAGLKIETSNGGSGPVIVSTVPVTVKAFFDPAVLNQPAGWVPNPDDVLNSLASPSLKSSSQAVALGSGQELQMSFAISV